MERADGQEGRVMWTLYVSDDLAYLCFNGQMRATSGYRTPGEKVRVDGLVARLRASTDAEAVQREMMEEAGRRRPDSIDDARYGDERHYYDD